MTDYEQREMRRLVLKFKADGLITTKAEWIPLPQPWESRRKFTPEERKERARRATRICMRKKRAALKAKLTDKTN